MEQSPLRYSQGVPRKPGCLLTSSLGISHYRWRISSAARSGLGVHSSRLKRRGRGGSGGRDGPAHFASPPPAREPSLARSSHERETVIEPRAHSTALRAGDGSVRHLQLATQPPATYHTRHV